jgi:formamidopyrimidine-DNA glycosylase
MPELPEVEVVRRGLQLTVQGRTLADFKVRQRSLRWPIPDGIEQRLVGRRLQSVGRRGKYLLLDFGDGSLIVHLGMSGTLRFIAEPQPPRRHDHVDLVFGHGLLRFHDPRRFGAMLWHEARDGDVLGHRLLASLGVEPFDPRFDGAWLRRGLATTTVPVKQALLAGQIVVGVGNIYASESLFRAGIRPTTRSHRVSLERCERLRTGSSRDARAGHRCRRFEPAGFRLQRGRAGVLPA